MLQAIPAKAVSILLLHISSKLICQRNAITLALCYITRLAFKYCLAPWAAFCFMLAHAFSFV